MASGTSPRLKVRLGLETARGPQADRLGLLWLGRGNLTVEDGNLRFSSAGDLDRARPTNILNKVARHE